MKTARIVVDGAERLGVIDRSLYGVRCGPQFVETQDLIWVGEKPIPNDDGVRVDTTEALRALSIGYLSAIGGTFYHWRDGVGPRQERPLRVNWWARSPFEAVELRWPMDFGTDEFVRFCRMSGAEPMMICNEEEPEGSRQWLEYCNYPGDSSLTRLRGAHGQPEPYGVRYWNVYGWLDLDPHIYAERYRQFALTARLIDPEIELIAAGGDDSWNRALINTLDRARTPNLGGSSLVDHLGQIIYTGASFAEVDYSDADYYRVLQNSAGLEAVIDERIGLVRALTRERKPWGSDLRGLNWIDRTDVGTPAVKLAFLEWGTRHSLHRQTMRDAVAHAGMLDVFHRRLDSVSMASHWIHLLLQCDGTRLWRTPTYHVFDLYRAHHGNTSVAVRLECERIAGREAGREQDFAGGPAVADLEPLPLLSASASVSPDGATTVLSVTNRHLTEEVRAVVSIPALGHAARAELATLTSRTVRDYNDASCPGRVHIERGLVTVDGTVAEVPLPPFSVNTLTLTTP